MYGLFTAATSLIWQEMTSCSELWCACLSDYFDTNENDIIGCLGYFIHIHTAFWDSAPRRTWEYLSALFCRDRRNDRNMTVNKRTISLPPQNMYQHNSRLGSRVQKEIRREVYEVVLDPPTAACIGKLPWWQRWHDWLSYMRPRFVSSFNFCSWLGNNKLSSRGCIFMKCTYISTVVSMSQYGM